jgi:predicted RNA-binding Zn-ribbon protein involved in translation (DUF1610 family)
MTMQDFVTVATHLTMADAEPERLALEAAGIPTIATDEGMGTLLGLTVVGGIKLQVATADAARAEEVLQELRAEAQSSHGEAEELDDGVTFNCPACGMEIWFPAERRGQVETCPECGARVQVPGT